MLDKKQYLEKLEAHVSKEVECIRFIAFHNPLRQAEDRYFRCMSFFILADQVQSLNMDLAYPTEDSELTPESIQEQYETFAKSLEQAIHNHRQDQKKAFMQAIKDGGLDVSKLQVQK